MIVGQCKGSYMFRSRNILLYLFLLCPVFVFAEGSSDSDIEPNQHSEVNTEVAHEPVLKIKKNKLILGLSYFSWTEKLTLEQGGITEYSRTQFSGTGLHLEKYFNWKHWGVSPELSLLYGGATGGGTSSTISYVAPRVSFWGAHAQLKMDYYFSSRIIFSVGPGVLYRNLKLQNDV